MIIDLKISIDLRWLFDLVLLFIFRWSYFLTRIFSGMFIVQVNMETENLHLFASDTCHLSALWMWMGNQEKLNHQSMLNHPHPIYSCIITTLGQPVRSRHLCLKSFWWLESGKVQTLSDSVLQKAHHFEEKDKHD